MNGASHDNTGEDSDDFCAIQDSSGEDSDDFDYDELLSSLEVTFNLHEEGEVDNSMYIFKGHTDEVYSVACSPIDACLVATAGKDNKGFLWKFGLEDSSLELQGHEEIISTLAFSRDGKFLASGNFDGLIKIWDAQLGIIKCTLEGSEGAIKWLKWHPEPRGYLVLAGSTDCSVRLWDADKGTHLCTFNGHASEVTCGVFSRNGKIICTGSNDGSLRIWNPETAESIHVKGRRCHTGGLTCVSINKDSTIALVGSNDNTARLVNLSSGKVIRTVFSHSDSVTCCGFAHDNPYIFATGSLDSKLIVWDTLSPAPICICEHKVGERAEGVTCLLWLKCLSGFITGSTRGRVRLWNYLYGTCLRTYEGHQGEIVSLSMTKYQQHIVSISRDSTARVFIFNYY